MFDNLKTVSFRAKRLGKTSFALNKLLIQGLREKPAQRAQLVKETVESLGSTYIKLGQLVASSPSLFPEHYVEAFQSCLDQTEALPFTVIEPILEKALGVKLKTRFRHIEPRPIASASIAQVHAATLVNGEQVVLKVQKPQVKQELETDFQFLQIATSLMEMLNSKAWKGSLKDIVEEIKNGMLEECNFYQEADNIEEFDRFLQEFNISHVVVPKVYRELSCENVLTMERFFGVPISDTEAVQRISPDPEFALMQALNTWFLSLKECQLYHADLHAGNVMMLNDGRIGFIDFGIVGRLSDSTWQGIMALGSCLPNEDFHGIAEALSQIGATRSEGLDLNLFAKDIEQFWGKMSGNDMLQNNSNDDFFKAVTLDLSKVSARHGIRFPREFTLLVKQFLYFDRYLRLLAPNASLFADERLEVIAY